MERSLRKMIYNDLPVRDCSNPNATVLHGKITGKLYTIDCGAYGKFLVTKEQYDSVSVGDDIPSYLRSY